VNKTRQHSFVSIRRGANFSLRDLHPTHFNLSHVPAETPINELPVGMYCRTNKDQIEIITRASHDQHTMNAFPTSSRICRANLPQNLCASGITAEVCFTFSPWFQQLQAQDIATPDGITVVAPFVGVRDGVHHDGAICILRRDRTLALVPPPADVRLDWNCGSILDMTTTEQELPAPLHTEVLILQNLLDSRLPRDLGPHVLIEVKTFDVPTLLLLAMIRAVRSSHTFILKFEEGWKSLPQGWQRFCENIGMLSFETAAMHRKHVLARAVTLELDTLTDLTQNMPVEKLLKFLNRNVDIVPSTCVKELANLFEK